MNLRKFKLAALIFLKFLSRNRKAFLAVAAIGTLLILSIVKFKPFIPLSLTEGIVGTYQEHDLPEPLTRLITAGLTKTDEKGRVIGDLATGWEVNSDATNFKFRLKKDLYWSDGNRIKSQDLEFSIPDVEVSYPDEEVVEFKLKDSFSPLPSLLTKPLFKKGTLTGTGPFRIEAIEKSRIFITKIILQPTKEGSYSKLIVRFYPNEKTAHLAFEIGEVQALLGVNDTTFISGNKVTTLKQITNFTKIVSLLYNTKDPLLSNRSLRQALGYSAPSIKDDVEAKTSISPSSWAYSSEVNDYLSNETQAKAALIRSKSFSSDEIFKKDIILTASPQLENVGKQIVAAWQDLGVRAVLRVEGGIPQNFQVALLTQSIPSDPDQYSLWHSTQTKTNLTKYSSARVDKDLEDGRKLIKEEDRKAKYGDFQRALLEDSPATFLYFPKFNVIYFKKTEGLLNQILPLQLPK